MRAWATDKSDRNALKTCFFGRSVCIVVYGKSISTVTSNMFFYTTILRKNLMLKMLRVLYIAV